MKFKQGDEIRPIESDQEIYGIISNVNYNNKSYFIRWFGRSIEITKNESSRFVWDVFVATHPSEYIDKNYDINRQKNRNRRLKELLG